MKKRAAGFIAAVAIAAVVAFVAFKGGDRDAPTATVAAAVSGATSPAGSISPEAVLRIAPGKGGANAPLARPLTPTLREFAEAKAFAPLYQRLKASTTRTPEEHWMLAKILAECATIGAAKRGGARWSLGGEDTRQRFVASLSAKDPDREKRIAAFDKINFDRCEGLDKVETSHEEIEKILELGAAGGDPKSRADLVRAQLVRQTDGRNTMVSSATGRFPTISDQQVDALKQVIGSGDPYALREGLLILTRPLDNFSLRSGATEQPIDTGALYQAALLAACDYGWPCGPDSLELMQSCALSGQCGAADYREFLFFFGASPNTSQRIGAYHQAILNATRSGDWSGFSFHNGPPPIWAGMRPGK